MRFFVLGATGGTGRALVEQALERGHDVTAFVRSPQTLGAPRPRLTVVEGDPRNATTLERALSGSDAVVSALGPPIPPLRRTTILGDAATATVAAMSAAGVRRLLAISGELQHRAPGAMAAFLRATLLRRLDRDQAELERVVRASALDWTIVRPTRLTRGALTRAYRAAPDAQPTRPRPVSRADVAHFLLDAAERGSYVRQAVGLAT
jgi:putative NADH-flavin reductase